MNFGHDVVSRGLLELASLRLYVVCLVVLAMKMFAVALVTARVRGQSKLSPNAEDAGPGGAVRQESPETERALRTHRNDLENIPLFLVLGLTAVLVGAHPLTVQIGLVVFTVARLLHSVFYLRSMQPWRSASFAVGLLAYLAVMAVTLARVF